MRHNNKILFKLMVVVLSLSGCNKYLDVNNDPNRVTDANITPELLFTQAEAAVGVTMSTGNTLFLNHWVGYSAQNGTFAPQQDEITYAVNPSFCNAIWVARYEVLFDLFLAEQKGFASGDTGVAAAAMILSAKEFQEVADLYGDAPYAEAFQVAQFPTPTFSKAQDIYKDLQLKLDSAITYFGGTLSSAFNAADIIAGGDPTTWIKFANTLKLRLLIRQSEVPGFDPSAEIAKIQANGGVLMAGESINVQPGFVNDVGKQNPFYSNFGWSPGGVVSTSSDNANDYIISQFALNNDVRVGYFFYPVGFGGTKYAGAVYGDQIANIPTAANLSYFGPRLVGTITPSNVGDGSGAQQTQWILPSFESMFFYAEAVARGWITGSAATAYANAVTESFSWLGVPNATTVAATYMSSNANANFANAGATAESKAKFIAYQKYLAMTMVDPVEAFLDINRLNMLSADNSYISLSATQTTVPFRLVYPQSELTTNFSNVPGDVTLYGPKLFWEP
jgi:hypothetical protein